MAYCAGNKSFFTFSTFIFLAAVFVLFSFLAHADETVKVEILSKQLRLLRESGGLLTLNTSKCVITDNVSERKFEIPKVDIFYNGRWILEASRPNENCDFLITGENLPITIGGETRNYPLPARIIVRREGVSITIEEDIYRYSADSAAAELGDCGEDQKEALGAQALVILARSKSNRGKTISDLTSDQIYRGRILSDYSFLRDGGWEIDVSRLKGELLFHAESGGKTMPQSVFAGREGGFPPVKDDLPFLGITLGKDDVWQRLLSYSDICRIFSLNECSPEEAKKLYGSVPSEKFRMTVNRVKGWNFIRSNNCSASFRGDGIMFEGRGLGHGCGMSQRGAMRLSSFGFSRYEILQHYYKGISFVNTGSADTYNLSYVLFDLKSGKILSSTSAALLDRKIPPGSISKIISACVYLHNDEFVSNYFYECSGSDRNMKINCWERLGHGRQNLFMALPRSCNLFFSSLSARMPYEKFKPAADDFLFMCGIASFYPDTAGVDRYRKLLCGLDFSVSVKIRDIVSLIRTISSGGHGYQREALYVKEALGKTFSEGTAKLPVKPAGDSANLAFQNYPDSFAAWGKTSSVIYGSNYPCGYGFFAGADEQNGVVVVLRNSTGQIAAQWGKMILGRKK